MSVSGIAVVQSVTIPVVIRKPGAYRDILVPAVTHSNASVTNTYAFSVAREFRSSVTGLAFIFRPEIPVAGPFDTIPADLIEDIAARNETEAIRNAKAFDVQALQYGLEALTRLMHANFRESEDHFAEAARSFDLAIVPQNKPDDSSMPNFAESALFHSGRPVLVVPYIQRDELALNCVLVGWDGSRAAARAVSDAWPLVERAKKVRVVTVGHGERPSKLQEEFAAHLTKHGVEAQMDRIAAEDIDAGNAILSHAADVQADLLILGGYGHSRLREWMIGGVTRTILQSMTVPTLLSH